MPQNCRSPETIRCCPDSLDLQEQEVFRCRATSETPSGVPGSSRTRSSSEPGSDLGCQDTWPGKVSFPELFRDCLGWFSVASVSFEIDSGSGSGARDGELRVGEGLEWGWCGFPELGRVPLPPGITKSQVLSGFTLDAFWKVTGSIPAKYIFFGQRF